MNDVITKDYFSLCRNALKAGSSFVSLKNNIETIRDQIEDPSLLKDESCNCNKVEIQFYVGNSGPYSSIEEYVESIKEEQENTC